MNPGRKIIYPYEDDDDEIVPTGPSGVAISVVDLTEAGSSGIRSEPEASSSETENRTQFLVDTADDIIEIVYSDNDEDEDDEAVVNHPTGNTSNFDRQNSDADFFIEDETLTDLSDLEYQNEIEDISSTFTTTFAYERYLKSNDQLIDWYLDGETEIDAEPTEDMIRYAEYNWKYSEMSSTDRVRLNRIRYFVETFLAEKKQSDKDKFWSLADKMDEVAAKKTPICPICRFDLRNDFHVIQKLCAPKCGHVYHKHCLKRSALKYAVDKCCVCNTKIINGSARRVYLLYK